jgi:hypothetical protein
MGADGTASGEQAGVGVRLPLDLKIVALLWIFVGVTALVGMVTVLFVGRVQIDLNSLALLVGLGLLKRGRGSRKVALFVLVLLFIFFGIVALLASMQECGWLGDSAVATTLEHGPTPVLLVSLAMMGLVAWQYRVLKRRRTRSLFAGDVHKSRPVPGAMKPFIIGVAALGVLVNVGWLYQHERLKVEHSGGMWTERDRGMMVGVHYGTRRGKLVYAVLQEQRGNTIGSAVNVVLGEAELDLPDGRELRLPSKHQLHEIIDGKYHTSDAEVTVDQLEAFLKSGPAEYSIRALLEFVEQPNAE